MLMRRLVALAESTAHHNVRINMADAELTKFTKALEKLCIDCGADVKKLLASCHNSINSRMGELMDDMKKVPVPNSAAADLDKVPQLVNAILKRESSRFASICTM